MDKQTNLVKLLRYMAKEINAGRLEAGPQSCINAYGALTEIADRLGIAAPK